MKQLLIFLFFIISSQIYGGTGFDDIDRLFRIYVSNVDIKSFTSRSLDLSTQNNAYGLKLVPQVRGRVAFALNDIIFRGNVVSPNLHFRIEVEGYLNGEKVAPVFCLDGKNESVRMDSTSLTFQRFYGVIPVLFEHTVDSIFLSVSNSHGVNLDQSLQLEDLQVLEETVTTQNPKCDLMSKGHDILFGIDGSSSMKDEDRKHISKYLKGFIKDLDFTERDSQLTVFEYGTTINEFLEFSSSKKAGRKLKSIKKPGDDRGDVQFTNWIGALNYAIELKPKLFVLVTDGWSNYYDNEPTYIFTHYDKLVKKCNELKENGTRLVIVASGMHRCNSSMEILSGLLSGDCTHIHNVNEDGFIVDLNKSEVVALNNFGELPDIWMPVD